MGSGNVLLNDHSYDKLAQRSIGFLFGRRNGSGKSPESLREMGLGK